MSSMTRNDNKSGESKLERNLPIEVSANERIRSISILVAKTDVAFINKMPKHETEIRQTLQPRTLEQPILAVAEGIITAELKNVEEARNKVREAYESQSEIDQPILDKDLAAELQRAISAQSRVQKIIEEYPELTQSQTILKKAA